MITCSVSTVSMIDKSKLRNDGETERSQRESSFTSGSWDVGKD
jgi:hypothetical protein